MGEHEHHRAVCVEVRYLLAMLVCAPVKYVMNPTRKIPGELLLLKSCTTWRVLYGGFSYSSRSTLCFFLFARDLRPGHLGLACRLSFDSFCATAFIFG